MKKKSLRQWIRKNRKNLDSAIREILPYAHLNDEFRRIWVLNDEGLYLWAKSQNVNMDN